jgi:hypothetical protein
MAQANLSTTVTVPQDDSGPDLGGWVAVLVLLLIAVCSCGALYAQYRIRNWLDNRRKYKKHFNSYARSRDDYEPDEVDYRQNDRRSDRRQTDSTGDRGAQHHHYYYNTPPPAEHGNAPHAPGKNHAKEQHTHAPEHSEEHRKSGHETHDSHSVKSDGASSSSRLIHSYTTPPVEVHPSHIPSIVPHSSQYSVQHSRAPSNASTMVAQSNHHVQPVHTIPYTPQFPRFSHPVPTIPYLPHPQIPTFPHFTPAPHPSAWHGGIWGTHSKIGTEDPDDSP